MYIFLKRSEIVPEVSSNLMILDIRVYTDKIILSNGIFLFVRLSLDRQWIFAVIFGYTSFILPILFESQQKSQGGGEGSRGEKRKTWPTKRRTIDSALRFQKCHGNPT